MVYYNYLRGGIDMELRTCDICGKAGVYSVNYSYDMYGNVKENTTNDCKNKGQLRIRNIYGQDICDDCFNKNYKTGH